MATVALLLGAVIFFAAARPASADNSRWNASYFPNVELTTQDGQKVHFYDDLLKGKIVVIDLIYTHCVDACPLETARLVQVQRMLGDRVGKDVFFYSISIDPKRDTPEVLKAYMDKFHVGPGWTFLTGKKDDIDLISKKMGLYQDPDPNDRDGHMPSVLIGNEATGQWLRNGATDNPRFLAVMIGDWMNGWKNAQQQTGQQDYTKAGKLEIKDQGQYVFATHCAACHTIGHGDKIGPDLQGITTARDRAWLARFIQYPDQMLAMRDPLAMQLFEKYKQVNMPNLRMTDQETADVLHFLESQSAPSPAAANGSQEKAAVTRTEPAVR